MAARKMKSPATGNWANAATTGEGANAATTGERANAATTGKWANAATTGEWANAATTGNWARTPPRPATGANAATTGENCHDRLQGRTLQTDRANTGTTGRSNAADGEWANGRPARTLQRPDRLPRPARTLQRPDWANAAGRANAATTGYRANASASGEHAVAARLVSKARQRPASAAPSCSATTRAMADCSIFAPAKVGEYGIKPDVWYSLDESGEFVEVEARP